MSMPKVLPAVASEATYMMSVSIRMGRGVVSLKSDELKDQVLAAALKANGVKSSDTLPVYEVSLTPEQGEWVKERLGGRGTPTVFSIQSGGIAVGSILDKLQERYMLCGASRRWWFVAQSDIAQVDAGIAQMRSMRKRVIEVLRAFYDEAKSLYEIRLTNVLSAANRMVDFARYVDEFPTLAAIEREFRVEVDGRIPVPSLVEVAKQSPEMQVWLGTIRAQLVEELPRIVDEMSGQIAEIATLCEKNLVKVSVRRSQKIAQTCERLGVLHKMYQSINPDRGKGQSPLVKQLVISTMALGVLNPDAAVEVQLLNLRQSLSKSDHAFFLNSGAGGKQLADWVGGRNAEDELKAIISELKTLEQLTPQERSARLSELHSCTQNSILKTQTQGQYVLDLLNQQAQSARQEVLIEPAEPVPTNRESNQALIEAGF